MKKIKFRSILLVTVAYITVVIGLLLTLNLNIQQNDSNRVLNSVSNLESFHLTYPDAVLPQGQEILPKAVHNAATTNIAKGAPYSQTFSDGNLTITSPIYASGQIIAYAQVTESQTPTLFMNGMIVFFAFMIYLLAAFLIIRSAHQKHRYTQNTVAKIKNIERSPLTQSYLITANDDKISIALNQLGESIQQQILSHSEQKENLYEFTEFFQFPIFIYNSKGKIRKTNAAFKNEFADTKNLDVFSPYAEFLSFLVEKMLHPTTQEKTFYFENINAHYQIRITPLPELDSRFLVTMLDVTLFTETLKSHSEFMANVSHEFKTPLASIKGFADLLSQENLPAEDTKQFAGFIVKESNRLISLVQDTLTLTKQNHHLEKKQVNLTELITDIVHNFTRQISVKNLDIQTRLSELNLLTSETMIYSVFENLIENAIKYTEQNGKIFISLTTEQDKILFSVTDNGPGLTELQQSRIFNRFYRVDESRSQVKGTGLGLSIVAKNLKTLGGEIDVVSIPNKGTTFTVTLPSTN